MNFSIRTIIRAWLAPKHRLSCSRRLWKDLLTELDHRGERCHEAGAFLLGVERGERREITQVVYYDDLDPHAYDTGACVLHGDAFAQLWMHCHNRGVTVVADVHTHPEAALQSHADRTNPMIVRGGHVAIIVPNYARPPVSQSNLGLYEYQGGHTWTDRSGPSASGFFYLGLWS